MSAILSIILAAIPNALLAIAAKFVTEKFLQSVLEKMIVYALKKLAPLSTNTLDDEIVNDIEKIIKGSE